MTTSTPTNLMLAALDSLASMPGSLSPMTADLVAVSVVAVVIFTVLQGLKRWTRVAAS